AVRDAVDLRITAAGGAHFEDGSRDVPLQQVDVTSARVPKVRELMDQQALARAGEPGEEDEARVVRERVDGGEHGGIVADDEWIHERHSRIIGNHGGGERPWRGIWMSSRRCWSPKTISRRRPPRDTRTWRCGEGRATRPANRAR